MNEREQRARSRRRRLTAGIVAIAAATVVLAVVTGGSRTDRGTTRPPKPTGTPKTVSTPPSAALRIDDIETDGTSLYLTTYRCPEPVVAGSCTPKSGFWNNRAPAGEKAHPVTLWRYADATWKRLGAPGVNSFAEMIALPGGLMFVPRESLWADYTKGPVRVSLDGGRDWEDWRLPWRAARCTSSLDRKCKVVVAGDYVVAADGATWSRRHIRSSEWEDISPPKRESYGNFDYVGWNVLALDDGTLVATANDFRVGGEGIYRVSRDFGSTWSAPHDNPGQTSVGHGSVVARTDGQNVYAECWEIVPGYGGDSGQSCGYYRSSDLEHWKKFEEVLVDDPQICDRPAGPTWAETQTVERVGGLVYEIAEVHYVDGQVALSKDVMNADAPHRARRVLEVSVDRCRTWTPVLD